MFVDQAPTLHQPTGIPSSALGAPAPPVVQVRPPSLGIVEPNPWPTRLLLIGALAGVGYLVWRQLEAEEEATVMPGIWVYMYDEDDDLRYLGEGWEPRASRRFDRRSDAEAYKAQQLPYFDEIEITEVSV